MAVGEKQLLSVTVMLIDATDQTLKFSSSDVSVAKINGMGIIMALKAGVTEIVEKKSDKIPVTDIEISDHEDKLEVDKTMTLTATVLPTDATDSKVKYESPDEKIDTVNSSGEVKGISKGNVTVSGKYTYLYNTLKIDMN